MKIICEKEKLLKGINSVINGVASKTTMPVLEGILIQTNDNELKLTSYDLEIGIEYIINDCNVQEQGATVVNAIMFTEIIRRLPDTDISITLNEKNLLVNLSLLTFPYTFKNIIISFCFINCSLLEKGRLNT